MCQVMQVSRSGYYKWKQRPPSESELRRKRLTERIEFYFNDSNQLYGSPKITHLLRAEGFVVSQKTVARIMRENGWRSRTVKKFKVNTTDSNHTLPISPNILNQQFKEVSKPNQTWTSDITYIHTREGIVYLASVLDLYTHKIVGWHADRRMTKELVLKALDNAYEAQKPDKGLLHHSDRGSQYASEDYRDRLVEYGMVSSMSRKGNCYDNACIESFHSILKRELVYLTKFKTREEAYKRLFEYIELFYNRKRIHSTLGYVSPQRFERLYYESKTNPAI